MKLLRYGPPGQEKPGLLGPDGKIRDLSGTVRDLDGETLSPASPSISLPTRLPSPPARSISSTAALPSNP